MLISFFTLGLLVSAATANQTTTADPMFADGVSSTVPNNSSIINVSVSMANATGGDNTSVSTVTATTEMQSNLTFTSGNVTKAVAPTTPLTTPSKPSVTPEVTTPAPEKDDKQMRTTAEPLSQDDNTGIIILVIIIAVAVGFAVACVVVRKRARRYSVDFTSRPDETNIPLSAVEPEMPADALPYNGKTFESAEVPAKEEPGEEPGEEPELEDEHKAEADKPAMDPSAESAAPPPDSVDDQPGAEAAEPQQQQQQQQSPPAPVEPAVEDKTDDEGVVSNKTSVESLKEANENNSNSADSSQTRDLTPSAVLWEVPLNSPV